MKIWLYNLVSNPATFFTALSAIGTIFLGLVSLWLARRTKVILGGYIENMLIFPEKQAFISLKCINKSSQDITVTGCDLKFRGDAHAIWIIHKDEFPKRLSYGEEVNLNIIDTQKFQNVLQTIVIVLKDIVPNDALNDIKKCKQSIKKIMWLDFRVNVPYINKTFVGNKLIELVAEMLINQRSSN